MNRRRSMAAGLYGLLLLLACGTSWAQQTVVEVIPLNYRAAEEIIPIIRPLLPPQGSVSGLNNKLIVRTTPENLAQIKQVLASIDAAPRRLLISVSQDADLQRSRRGGQISGRVEIGDNVTIGKPGRPTPPGASVSVDGARAKVYSGEEQQSNRISQQVQVLEGNRALIRVGQSVPVRSRQYVDTPQGRRIVDTTEYQDVDTGFYVVPRVSGDRVTLEIFTAADSLRSPATGAANIQRVQTVVSGRLGEWIELAGIGEQAVRRDSEILGSSTDARRDVRRVSIKVDEIR
jgi:hypothetical protein